jgi:hypothetical protein
MAFSGGLGTVGNPYLISNTTDLTDLCTVTTTSDVYFLQTNDITLGTITRPFNSNGTTAYQQNYTYDGAGYKIKDGSLSTSTYITNAYPSLFGYLAAGGTIKNVKLKNIAIYYTGTASSIHVGILLGNCYGIVSNCVVESDCLCDSRSSSGGTGGIAGNMYATSTNGCGIFSTSNSGNVYGVSVTGGICGRGYLVIYNCYNSGYVESGTTSGTGGIVGYFDGSNTYGISKCYNSGIIKAIDACGGICGYIVRGYVENSFALQNKIIKSTQSSASYFGRVAGRLSTTVGNAVISNCYALSTMVLSNGWL